MQLKTKFSASSFKRLTVTRQTLWTCEVINSTRPLSNWANVACNLCVALYSVSSDGENDWSLVAASSSCSLPLAFAGLYLCGLLPTKAGSWNLRRD